MSLKIVFLGPPGAGKGTQAKQLATRRGLAHISTGEMLRSAIAQGSALGKKVQSIIDSGQLVSDDIMVELIAERTAAADCSTGYILDGFPRTVKQADALEKMLTAKGEKLDAVVLFQVSEEAVRSRLENRRAAESRADDNAAVQLERMRVYREQTAPLIAHYQQSKELIEVDASGDVDAVYAELEKSLANVGR